MISKKKNRLLADLMGDLFFTSLIFYCIFVWLDLAYKEYVSDYFYVNAVLGIVIISGVFMMILRRFKK